MSLQVIVDNAVSIEFIRTKLVGQSISRSGAVKLSQVANNVPWRMTIDPRPGMQYANFRYLTEEIDRLDRVVVSTIDIGKTNPKLAYLTQYQGDLSNAQLANITVSSAGNLSIIMDVSSVSVANTTVVFAAGDFVQPGNNHRYPYTVTSTVLRGDSSTITVPINRPFIEQPGYTAAGANVRVGVDVTWDVVMSRKPSHRVVPGGYLEWADVFELVEVIDLVNPAPAPPPPPPPESYRYWRILFNGVAAGDRVGLSEIEFLDKRYYRRVTSGAVFASGFTSDAYLPIDANDGRYSTTGSFPTAFDFWQSNTGATPIWYMRDAGDGNSFACEGVTLTRADEPVTFTGFDVQHSSDNSSWTTEWTVSNVSALTNSALGPVAFTNTNLTVFEPTAGFDTANVVLWLKSYDGAFTGNLTGAATDGDPVQTMTNHAAGFAGANVLIKQTTLANRPIFRTGGVSSMPYLEFDNAEAHHFETIPYVMPSSITDQYPGATGILADITDPANSTLAVYPVLGQAVTDNPRKNNFVYVNDAVGDFFVRAQKSSLTAYTNEIDGVHTLVHAVSTFSRNQFIRREDDLRVDWVVNTGSATYDGSAVTTSELFKTVESSGTTYYMKGKVYELILDLGTANGNTTTDFWKAQFNGYAIQQYLEGRRLYGAP